MHSDAGLTALVQRLIEAENERNARKAEEVLAQDFTAITRSRGEEQDRGALVREIANPPDPDLLRRADEFWERASEDVGVVRSVVTITDRSNPRAEPKRFRNTHVFQRQGEGWKCVSWQVTPVTPGSNSIEDLQAHAELQAYRLRVTTIVLAAFAPVPLAAALVAALFREPATDVALSWGIAWLTAAAALSAIVLLAARIVWNFSNVWLGRAGTLEDLHLALDLMGIDPSIPRVPPGRAAELLQVIGSLERLRRGFEGDLLKGPALEVPKLGK